MGDLNTCRICGAPTECVLDLGKTPPANSLKKRRDEPEAAFPLVLHRCDTCGNLQLRDCLIADDLYRNYLYVTPSSPMLSRHYRVLIDYLSSHGHVNAGSRVLEIGSNAGLFLEAIAPDVSAVVGVDPATAIAAQANAAGIPTVCDFFNADSAARIAGEYWRPDLIVARHCFAHNCSPHEMLGGVTKILADDGLFVIENAYALNTVEQTEFDQIYHEHMFYYSVRSMRHLLQMHGMTLVDVMTASIHGGSIVFVAARATAGREPLPTVERALERETAPLSREGLGAFAQRTREAGAKLRRLVSELRAEGRTINTYGATAKGNTLLNYSGLTASDIPFCADSTEIKQGRYLPQSNILVISEEQAFADPPDYFLLTAWNYQEEIVAKVRARGNIRSKFIVPIPEPHII